MNSKNIWIGAAIILVVVVGAYLVGQNNKVAPTTGLPLLKPAQATAPQPQTAGGEQEPLVSLGADSVTQGNTTFSDTITDLGSSISGNALWWPRTDTAKTTSGKFVEVDIKMVNNSLEGISPLVTITGLYDQAGRYYPYQMGHSSCGTAGFTEGKQYLAPNIPCTMKTLFEVSKESTSFTLKFYYKEY